MKKFNPFKYVSKYYVFGIIAILGYIATNFGFVTAGELNELVALWAQAGGIFGAIIDRVSRGDISIVGWRKK